MYSLVQISLYLLCCYMWALVQHYIRSRVKDSFPPIPYALVGWIIIYC